MKLSLLGLLSVVLITSGCASSCQKSIDASVRVVNESPHVIRYVVFDPSGESIRFGSISGDSAAKTILGARLRLSGEFPIDWEEDGVVKHATVDLLGAATGGVHRVVFKYLGNEEWSVAPRYLK